MPFDSAPWDGGGTPRPVKIVFSHRCSWWGDQDSAAPGPLGLTPVVARGRIVGFKLGGVTRVCPHCGSRTTRVPTQEAWDLAKLMTLESFRRHTSRYPNFQHLWQVERLLAWTRERVPCFNDIDAMLAGYEAYRAETS